MTVPESGKTWRKSSYSSQGGDCVEVRADLDAVRDSKNPGEVLPFPPTAVTALLRSLG
jgi:hypothetical protein